MDACTCNPKWIGCSSILKSYAGHRGTKGLLSNVAFMSSSHPHKSIIGEFYTLLSQLGLKGWNGTTLIETNKVGVVWCGATIR